MRSCRAQTLIVFRRAALGATLLATALGSLTAQDKPTGAPLVLSSVETEQEIPLAILLPDGKTANCVTIRLHWTSQPSAGPNEDATSFSLDLPPENPAAPVFTAQLWNASLASALAWQQPWEGARWKVIQTPVSDGSGIDAALAVGMIATSARRPYPPKTLVIGSLNPDGSLGAVSHLMERLDAAAQAGITRVIIPSVQRFDMDDTGQVVNMVRHASDIHLECIPVDDLVTATETVMNDPLPDTATLDSAVPRYGNDITSYIDTFAQREINEAESGLKFAPKEADLSTYPPRLAAIWKSVYADTEAGQQAYQAGQVYVAYQFFAQANGKMNGANALAGQTRIGFDVKAALEEADDLHDHLQVLMNPPSIDQGSLQSSLLVAEMADWAFDINASLEGAELVTKQAFSQRSDATEAQKDRAREAILFANEQCKYLLTQSDFYTGLLAHISGDSPATVDENAAHLLPQLIPAQLATARAFTDGIRASDLRDALLFDPRLVAYVNVLRQIKTEWDARLRRKEIESQAAANAPAAPSASSTNSASATSPMKLDSNAPQSAVGFDPGDTYRPPHTVVVSTDAKKLTDVALCLIWANHDCEIATLDEKYLRLGVTVDPTTHEWHIKDKGKLDALLQMAEIGARHGIAFAEKAEIDPSILAMIYERAAHERIQDDDASALDSLRDYWRCALLGNVCWQLAHVAKAQPVDLSTVPPSNDNSKPAQASDKTSNAGPTSTNTVVVVNPPTAQATTNEIVTPVAPIATNVVNNPPEPAPNYGDVPANPPVAPIATNADDIPVAPIATNSAVAVDPPVAPIATNMDDIPVAPIATNENDQPAPPVPQPADVTTNSTTPSAPAPTPPATAVNDESNIPVAPIAKADDYSGPVTTPTTNAAPNPATPTQ